MRRGVARVRLKRALLEVGLLAWLLTLALLAILAPQPADNSGWAVLTLGLAYVGLFSALVGALRLQRSSGGWRASLGREVGQGAAVLFAIWLGALLALVMAALLTPLAVSNLLEPTTFVVGAPVFAWFTAALGGPIYAIVRALALLWPAWDRRRRTRLLWSLTHAQLKASLALALLIAVTLARVSASHNPWAVPVPHTYSGVAQVVVRFLPEATAFLVLGALAALAIVPLAALITWSVLQRTTRRLEDLTRATDALRAGQFTARVAVSGEDEVARLQTDFNAMAADLERTLSDLQGQRDRVVRLLAAQRELVAGVSHELRTPVATLRAYLDSSLTNWNGEPSPSLRHDLTIMVSETERLQRLIDDLFTLSRAEVGRLTLQVEPTDVAALLRRCAETAGPLAWARGRVEVVVEAPQTALALADAGRLEQVVRNLIANAVRHTPPGGLVLLTAQACADGVLLQVKDSGEGIAPEDLPRIWERFYRTDQARDRDQGGAGLGLALVRELTEAMGGSVSVESALGQGSCFSLRLPLA